MIVTSDSLGQAVAQALGKKVVTLYGPTNYLRMRGIPNVTVLPSSLKCPHLPCFLPVCKFNKFCMDYISPEKVAQICKGLLANKRIG
jgi:ADP-heptose:LPS heptosyltransferase